MKCLIDPTWISRRTKPIPCPENHEKRIAIAKAKGKYSGGAGKKKTKPAASGYFTSLIRDHPRYRPLRSKEESNPVAIVHGGRCWRCCRWFKFSPTAKPWPCNALNLLDWLICLDIGFKIWSSFFRKTEMRNDPWPLHTASASDPLPLDSDIRKLLCRVTMDNEKISTVVEPEAVSKFQEAYCKLLRNSMNELKREKKKKKPANAAKT